MKRSLKGVTLVDPESSDREGTLVTECSGNTPRSPPACSQVSTGNGHRSPHSSAISEFRLWKKLQVSWLSQAFSHNVCSECQHTNSTSSNSCVNFVDLTSDQLCKFWKQAANVRWHKSPVTSILSLSTAISLALGNGSQTFLAIRITWKIYPDRKLDLMPEFLIHQAGCGDWVFAFLTSSTAAISARVFSLEHSNTGQIYTELTLRRKLNSNMSIPGEFFT